MLQDNDDDKKLV